MVIPDLTVSGKTDPTFPPFCSAAVPRRKAPGATYLWTLSLMWDIGEELPGLPSPFSRDRGDILAAVAGTGPAYRRAVDHQTDVQVSISVRVGQERVPVVEGASAVLKRMAMSAAEGSVSCKALLVVEGPQSLATAMLDVLDADLDISVVTTEQLPFANRESAENLPLAVDRKPEPRRRPRRQIEEQHEDEDPGEGEREGSDDELPAEA